jgi:hypothetical protein
MHPLWAILRYVLGLLPGTGMVCEFALAPARRAGTGGTYRPIRTRLLVARFLNNDWMTFRTVLDGGLPRPYFTAAGMRRRAALPSTRLRGAVGGVPPNDAPPA